MMAVHALGYRVAEHSLQDPPSRRFITLREERHLLRENAMFKAFHLLGAARESRMSGEACLEISA